ncbi:MAG: BTAD domain-containing putative transcriptional regulator [Rubrivivax sp.]
MHAIDWLGAVVLCRQGVPLPLSIRKTQALLILLAREGSMPRERIVALLWPALDESTARRNLRRELARLRDAGAGEVLQAEGDRLAIAPQVEVTARRFEAELQADRPDEALALWRGAPADGLHLDDAEPWNEWLAQERRRLEALRAQALVRAAAQHEAAGAFDVALDRVRGLLAADPLQERHHVAAMRLLDRLGQREAALAQYDTCVRLLADELGLQPMEATRAMAAALRGSGAAAAAPSPGPPSPAPVDLLPAQLPFVGREREVAWLERAWRSGKPLLIEGEGGVGKTRLITDFASAHGPYAIVPCRAGDAELPLASFTRALRALAGPEPEVQGLPGWVRDELARLMPELGHAPLPLRSEDERLRFGQACTRAWTHWAEGNFDAIVVDDWHLADAASQAMWMQVHGGEPASPRLILVYRPGLGDSAAELLRRLSQGGGDPLHLKPLPPDAVFELIRRLSGRPEPKRFAAMLGRATDGNPFYMAETLRHLVDQGLLTAAADGTWRTPFDDRTENYRELPLPDSVRTAVLARVARLPDRARRVLEAAALADEPFGAELLAPACALSEVEASLALEEALQARLLREVDEGGLGFAHHLVQQALEASLDAARRRSVHRRLALGAAAAGAPAARIAAHHEAGGEARRAVPWRRRAGDEAMRLQAIDDAILHWRQALSDGASDEDTLAIGPGLIEALITRDLDDEVHSRSDELLRLVAQGAGSEVLRIEAQIAVARSRVRRDPQLARNLLDALPALTDSRLRAQVLLARSVVAREQGRVDEAGSAGREALAAEGLTAAERVRLLESLASAEFYAGHVQQALQFLAEARTLAEACRDRIGLLRVDSLRGAMLAHAGDLAAAEAVLRETADLAGQMGMVGVQRQTLFHLCMVHSSQSRPDAVLSTATECWSLRPAMALDTLRTMVRLAFVEAHQALGDLGGAHRWALGAIDDASAIGQLFGASSVVLTVAELLTVLDDSARLTPLLTRMDGPDSGESVHATSETWLVLAECHLLDGRIDEARDCRRRSVDAGHQEMTRVAARVAIVDAALLQAAGDDRAALERLPADGAGGLNDELRWRALATRLRAEAATGGCQAATLAAADAALTRDGVHALAALLLHQALLRVAETPARRRGWQRRVEALSQTLQGLPDLRARFEQRWRVVGP